MLKTVVYFCGKRDKFIRIFLMNRKFIRTAFFFNPACFFSTALKPVQTGVCSRYERCHKED